MDTVPATGTVTLNGQPVEGAAVTFSPEGDGHAAAAVTDASGKFVLSTELPEDGAVPGTYQVGITKYEKTAEVAPGETDIDAIYAAAEAAGENIAGTGDRRGDENKGPRNLLPEQYKNPQTSNLDATVTEDGENDFTFELSSQ